MFANIENVKEGKNNDCLKCNKDDRSRNTQDGICNQVASYMDNLPIRCVGDWSKQKISMLVKYFGIFAVGMKNKWDRINYVEICSGPGRCIIKETGEEIDGTSLAIINHYSYEFIFKSIFIDNNQNVVETLNNRIESLSKGNASAICANYNKEDQLTQAIIDTIGTKGLFLIFIDPTDCSVPFNLIRKLDTKLDSIDFIINMPVGTDFNRNVKNVILKKDQFKDLRKKYVRFLDDESFFNAPDNLRLSELDKNKELRSAFRTSYFSKLNDLGYKYVEGKSVKNYYDIVICTKHQRGLDFWKKAQKYDINNQQSLFTL
jgi:three-Cys-motif partner protein